MNALTVGTVRNVDGLICIAALGFTVFDAFSKRANISQIKNELSLRRAQLVSKVVSEIENAVGHLLAAGRQTLDFMEDDHVASVEIFDEQARDAITALIRNNEECFAEINLIGRLPREIRFLNGAVYWSVLSDAVFSGILALILLLATVAQWFLWVSLLFPLSCIVATMVLAAARHMKGQIADEQILKNYP